jgi:hypothetical protein
MPSQYRVRHEIARRLDAYSGVPKFKHALLGHSDGVTVQVNDDTTLVWITDKNGQSTQIVNRRVPNNWGEVVRVGKDPHDDYPEIDQVLGYADVYDNREVQAGPDVMIHAAQTHAYSKRDCDWIEPERMLWLMPVPVIGENKFDLWPFVKYTPGGVKYSFAPTRLDYSAHIPESGVRICIPVIDSTGSFDFRDGAIIDARELLTASDWPALLPGDSASYGLWFSAGMTELHHELNNDDLIDLRGAGIIGGNSSIISPLNVQEVDGTPSIPNVSILKFPNGSLTDEGAGAAKVVFPDIDALTNSAAADEGDVLTVVGGSAVFLPPTGGGGAGLEYVDCSDQVTGTETHFIWSTACSAVAFVINGKLQKPADITLDGDGLGAILAYAPVAGSNLIFILSAAIIPPAPQYRKGATMWHDESVVVAGNSLVTNRDSRFGYGTTTYQEPPADGDATENGFTIAVGTYTLHIEGFNNVNQGRLDIRIGGTLVGQIDFYDGSSTGYTHIYTLAGITLTAGYHKITFTVNGTSGSYYYIEMSKIWLTPQGGY